MFIDPERKLIFIHNPKAAGTSIRSAMSVVHETNHTSPEFKIKYDDVWGVSVHSFASRVRLHPRVSEYWDESFKFGVVRNPWERAVSAWEFCHEVHNGQTILRRGFRELPDLERDRLHNNIVNRIDKSSKAAFAMFLQRAKRHHWTPWEYLGPEGRGGFFDFNQWDWFSEGNKQIVDRVYKIEELRACFKKLGVTPQHENRTRKRFGNWRDLYTNVSHDQIERWFSRDIKRWGYTFQ